MPYPFQVHIEQKNQQPFPGSWNKPYQPYKNWNQSMFSDNNEIKLEINFRIITGKYPKTKTYLNNWCHKGVLKEN